MKQLNERLWIPNIVATRFEGWNSEILDIDYKRVFLNTLYFQISIKLINDAKVLTNQEYVL